MLGPYKLVVDEWAEVWDLLQPYADASFWQWNQVDFDPDCRYIIGRLQLKEHWKTICDLARNYPGRIIFCNPAEGSETILLQLKRLRIRDLVENGQLGLITSGELEFGIHYLKTDGYFTNIVTYTENQEAYRRAPEVLTSTKHYDFLFLNGRLRPHRKYLIDRLRHVGVLERSLWSNLNRTVSMPWSSSLVVDQTEPLRFLPEHYEIPRSLPNLAAASQEDFAKHVMFGNTWGDAIVNPLCYIDSCFSLVTETIFDYPYTFRTEKIWKPMIMLHPFVVAANWGFYRDLRAAGFRTFDHIIDESFDLIDDPRDRADRIVAIVQDICYNGAWDFLTQSRAVCEHNYARLQEHNQEQRQKLPPDLAAYIERLS